MIYDVFDVVVVPFPFTDRASNKRRPALVLSDGKKCNKKVGHCVLTMITSSSNSPWPLDVEINDLDSAGLTSASKVRMKLFTLDERLIIRRAGSLAEQDKKLIKKAIQQLINVY